MVKEGVDGALLRSPNLDKGIFHEELSNLLQFGTPLIFELLNIVTLLKIRINFNRLLKQLISLFRRLTNFY